MSNDKDNDEREGFVCPFLCACMYCRPYFVVTNPLAYVAYGGTKGYECTMTTKQANEIFEKRKKLNRPIGRVEEENE